MPRSLADQIKIMAEKYSHASEAVRPEEVVADLTTILESENGHESDDHNEE